MSNLIKWIPNSEKLPEYNVEVLICTEDGDMHVGYLSKLRLKTKSIDCMRDSRYGCPIVCPDAWMPLPKPYKGECDE